MKLFTVMETAFENFDNTVRTYLQKTFNDLGFNYTHNQIFGVIFDGIKGIMQNAMFYIEDAFTEQNVYTATRKKSIYSLAKISGYDAYYGSAATGTIIVKIKNNQNYIITSTSKIYINNNTVLMNSNTNVYYTLKLPTNYYIIDLNKPLTTHEFKVIQGVYRTATYVAEGTELETFNIYASSYYDENYITVSVDGEEWERASNLYEMTENGKQYIIDTGYDNTINVIFGNGVNGKILDAGQSVVVSYINHMGDSGNINNYDNYSLTFITTGKDANGNVINLNDICKVTVNSIISGGTDPDSIDTVRMMIGYNSRSNVLASEQNFKLFLNRFSFIGQSSIWSEENTSSVTIAALTNYYTLHKNIEDYYSSDISDFFLTYEQKEMILDTLNNSNKAFAGISVKFQDPIIRKFSMICYVKADNNYKKDDIKENIKNIVADYFINLESNITFVAKSDIIKTVIDNDDNIIAFDFNFVSDIAEKCYKTGYYEKYYLKYSNKGYAYSTKKIFYEAESTPGLDAYGNISLDSNIEIPMIRGGFNYYPNKSENDSTAIRLDDIQIFFI